RRSRHSAASARPSLGFLTVTHPFHALSGERLEILYAKRRSGALVFVCARGVNGTITVPQAWTDRGGAPAADRLSAEGLGASRVLVDALMRRGEQAAGGAS
ncbi:DUF5372 family protein, partial [Streptomyces cadmiisoli]|uniref:DUF5372 family protein n=1 Tax=Streptomyces cadmiisoli TaxID=2184053 RepID=UPI0036596422